MPLPEITVDPIRYGKVKWTALFSSVDTDADPDDVPDKAGISGVIIFKPSVPSIAFPSATPKYTCLLFNRQVSLIDAQVDELGRKFVKLEASVTGMKPETLTWTATFNIGYNGVNLRIPDVTFSLTADQELDLTDLINN